MGALVYDRIKELCEEKGMNISRLEVELGFSTATIQRWKNSTTPNSSNLIKVARYFNVSTDYLLGITDVATTLDDFTHDADIISLQRARTKMSERDRKRMMDMIRIGFDYAFSDENNDSE